MEGNFDLSKIIGLISENPEIITMIKGLITSDTNTNSAKTAAAANENNEDATVADAKVEVFSAEEAAVEGENETAEVSFLPKLPKEITKKQRRKDLLCALKPYVRGERGRVIDTMLSLTEVLDVLKRE